MSISRPSRANRPVAHQVSDYLMRLRRSAPFPCDLLECYYGCMPAQFKAWKIGDTPRSTRAMNAVKVFNLVETTDPLHFQFHDKLASANDGEAVFWIAAPIPLPAPSNTARDPIMVPEDHTHGWALKAWYDAALHIEEQIADAIRVVGVLDRGVCNTGVLQVLWPELLNFVKVPVGNRANARDLKGHALTRHTGDKEMVTDLLAQAVMIPEQYGSLPAWVGYHTSKEV